MRALVLADTRASADTPAGRTDRQRIALLAEELESPQPAMDAMLPRLFSPHLQVLDSGGNVMREIPRTAFVFHGASLYVGLRIHSEERYLIVSSDAASVGNQVTQIFDDTQVSTSASGGFLFQVHTGSETTSTHFYAYNGSITLAAQPMPMVK